MENPSKELCETCEIALIIASLAIRPMCLEFLSLCFFSLYIFLFNGVCGNTVFVREYDVCVCALEFNLHI